MERKVKLFIGASVDGFISTQDDNLDWMDVVNMEGEDYGYADFTADVDTYIIGRKTYDWVINKVGELPQAKQFDCYILTRGEAGKRDGVTFYNGSLPELIRSIKAKPGKDIYCDGGGEIVKLFMENDLIDTYIISVIPVILGDGKRLFQGGIKGFSVQAESPKYFESGLVQLRYERKPQPQP